MILACGWFASAACASLTQPRADDLHGAVKRFHHDLRWKYNQQAAARVNPAFAAAFRERLEDLGEELSITAWDLRRVEMDPDGRRGIIRVYLRYVRMPSTVVRSARIEQEWRQVGGTWILMNQRGGPLEFPSDEIGSGEGVAPAGPRPDSGPHRQPTAQDDSG